MCPRAILQRRGCWKSLWPRCSSAVHPSIVDVRSHWSRQCEMTCLKTSKNSHQTCVLGLNQQDWLQWKSTNLRLQHQGPKPAEVPVISMILQGRLRKVWYGLMRLLHKEFKCPNRIHPDPLLFSTALKCCCSCETVKLLSWFATVSSLRKNARCFSKRIAANWKDNFNQISTLRINGQSSWMLTYLSSHLPIWTVFPPWYDWKGNLDQTRYKCFEETPINRYTGKWDATQLPEQSSNGAPHFRDELVADHDPPSAIIGSDDWKECVLLNRGSFVAQKPWACFYDSKPAQGITPNSKTIKYRRKKPPGTRPMPRLDSHTRPDQAQAQKWSHCSH